MVLEAEGIALFEGSELALVEGGIFSGPRWLSDVDFFLRDTTLAT